VAAAGGAGEDRPATGVETVATGRGVGFTVGDGVVDGTDLGVGVLALGACCSPDWSINSLIFSTVDVSRLAKALTLTSSPHFWIRSSSSWLFSPSSFANS
jgi:hypothetical protein